MMQKTVNRLTIAVAVAMFFAAIFVLYRELENTRLIDVVGSLEALPKTRVILELALTAASYLLLTGYDFLALSYADHKLRSRETLFASFISFTCCFRRKSRSASTNFSVFTSSLRRFLC